MATIEPYRTKAGRQWRVRYRKPDRSQTDKRGFRTKRDAQLFAASVEVDKSQGTYIDPTAGRRTVTELWPILEASKSGGKASTKRNREVAWRLRVQPEFGTRAVASVLPSEITAWAGEMVDDGRSRTVISDAVTVLRGLFDIAVQDRLIPASPVGKIDVPARGRKPQVFLTHPDVQRLAESSRYPAFTYTLAYCGLRWGEAAALRVMDVDTRKRILRVRQNQTEVSGRMHLGTPKSGAERDVPYPNFLTPMLRPLLLREGGARVFVTTAGEPMRNSYAMKDGATKRGWFVRARERAGVELTPHDLRHTAASFAVSAGANVKVLQRMLGHASAAVTLDVYSSLFDTDLTAVADALDRARAAAL